MVSAAAAFVTGAISEPFPSGTPGGCNLLKNDGPEWKGIVNVDRNRPDGLWITAMEANLFLVLTVPQRYGLQ